MEKRKRPVKAGKGERWPMDSFLPYRISLLATAFRRAVADLYRPVLGLGENEWKVLVTVAHYGPLPSSEVGAHMTLDRMSVSRGLNRLVASGLVSRVPHPADQRVFDVALTTKGEAAFAPLARQGLALERRALRDFSDAEKKELLRLLGKLDMALRS